MAVFVSLFLAFATLSVSMSWAQVAAVFLGRRDLWDAGDFATLYAAAQLVATGQAHGLYDLDVLSPVRMGYTDVPGADRIAYLNPPFFAAALAPLSWFSFGRAYQIWTGVSVAFVAATAWLIWPTTPTLSRWQRAALILGLVTAYPLALALRLGQFSTILMLSWAAAYALLRTGRERAAGAALSLLLIKPELLIPVAAFLWWKRRYAVLSTLLPLTAIAVLASLAIVGPTGVVEYPVFVVENARRSENGTMTTFMFGWNGWFGALLGKEQPLRATLISLPFVAATITGAILAWRGPLWTDGDQFPRKWLALTLATVLVDPNLFLQDTVIIVPAVYAAIGTSSGRTQRILTGALVLGWIAAGFGLSPGSKWHFNLLSTELIVGLIALVWFELRAAASARLTGMQARPGWAATPRARPVEENAA